MLVRLGLPDMLKLVGTRVASRVGLTCRCVPLSFSPPLSLSPPSLLAVLEPNKFQLGVAVEVDEFEGRSFNGACCTTCSMYVCVQYERLARKWEPRPYCIVVHGLSQWHLAGAVSSFCLQGGKRCVRACALVASGRIQSLSVDALGESRAHARTRAQCRSSLRLPTLRSTQMLSAPPN